MKAQLVEDKLQRQIKHYEEIKDLPFGEFLK